MVKLLQKGLAGWQGFTDMEGEEIPFSTEKVKELCECDPDFMAGLATRIQHVARMGELIEWRGCPREVRCDNGPEYVSGIFQSRAEKGGIRIRYIQPVKPRQNGYAERYNRTVRYDWLNQYLLESLEEIREFATAWLWTCNNERPNMGIGGITPAMKLKRAAWALLLNPATNGEITTFLPRGVLVLVPCAC